MRFWCLAFIAVFSLAKGQTLDSGLVFCLPINNSVVDEVSDRIITSFGYSLTQDRRGRNAEAIQFNGSTDYIEVDGFGYDLPEREITISFWAKTEEVKSHFVCVMMPNNPNNRLSIVINYWHSGFKYHFWDVQNTSEGRLGVTPIYEDTDWHFYAFTNSYNKGEMRAYKDGVLMERKYAQVSTYQGKRNLRIGKGDVPGSNFHGSIDEFRIYNRVLTNEEIKLLQSADRCSLSLDTTQNSGTWPCGYGGFKVAPNPALSQFIVKGNTNCIINGTAELYDCLGRKLMTVPFVENEALFRVQDLASAMYFVRIKDESGLVIVDKKQIIGL